MSSNCFGFVTIQRQIINWQWYSMPVHRSVFMHCILKSNFKDNMKGKTLIKRGSFVTSCQILADELGYSKKTILRALIDLENTKELSRKTSNKGTMISITKYDSYQSIVSPATPQATPQATPPSKRKVSTNNNVNKDNNVNNIIKPKKNKASYSNNLVNLFSDDEIITWLQETGTITQQDALYLKFEDEDLIRGVSSAYEWQAASKKNNRKASTFLTNWFESSFSKFSVREKFKQDLLIAKLETMGFESEVE